MNIIIKVKPTKVVARTKEELMAKIHRNYGGIVFGSNGNFHRPFNRNSGARFVYTMQKLNRKTVQERYKRGDKKGQYKKSTILREKHWVAHVYNFKDVPVKVKQNGNTFDIE